MKKLCVLCLALTLFIGCFTGCGGHKTDSVSSTVSTDNATVEAWNQSCPEPVPENKIYTVYCLPTSGVIDGIATDPKSRVKSVENIGNLYFNGFQNDVHIIPDSGEKPQNNMTQYKTEKQENHRQISTFEFGGYVYDAEYIETRVITECINLDDKQKTYESVLDKFSLVWQSDDDFRFADVYLERTTGRIVKMECDSLIDGIESTKESARKKGEAIFSELNGFDMPLGTELRTVNYGNWCDGYEIFVHGYSVNQSFSTQMCDIRIGSYDELLGIDSYINLQKYIDAIEYYGKSAIDEAINVLKSSLDDEYLIEEVFLDFDGNGELFCRIYSRQGYNSQGCWCSTPRQYCVKVVKLPEEFEPRFKILDTKGNTVITENHIEQANVGDGTMNGKYYVHLKLDRTGTELLKYITSQSLNKILPFYLDGELIFEPTVVAAIENGEFLITVDTKEKAESIYEGISSAMHGEEK